MILIDDILISDDVVQEHFSCALSVCKGACCIEGDMGAPLLDKELQEVEDAYEIVKYYLPPDQVDQIEKKGKYRKYNKGKVSGTELMEDGRCVFLMNNGNGGYSCSFEVAYEQGKIGFPKPVSCQLYPVRVSYDERTGFTAVNYDRWDICSAACVKGAKMNVYVYEFVKQGLIRRFGKDFYQRLEQIATGR